ncbi:MAG: hypothetical protein IT204_18380 [Fimbriimonadaceae bacterium]|nr:hypothetical protein [Fimbriimonadaceae bacterium]
MTGSHGTPPPGAGITWRSVLLGTLCTAFLAWGAPYAMHVLHASYLALDFSTPGALALLFGLVTILNPLAGRLRPGWRLSGAELVVIFTMLLMASAVIEMGLASQILPILATPAYYATPENKWQELFVDRLPPGIVLRDVDAARRFFEGGRNFQIDWNVWLPVLFVWTPLLLALYAVMLASMVILRRQWDERERLAYPLTQVPLALVDERQSVLRQPALWVGFGIAFGVMLLKGLHFYFPAVPDLRLDYPVPVFGQYGSLIFRVSFPMLGFFFLVNLDAAFSLWFFNLLFFAAQAAMLRLGYEFTVNLGPFGTTFALYKYLGWGAMVALVGGALYMARQHLGEVWRRALGRPGGADDSTEALSYRGAVVTVLVGLTVMVWWLTWSGLPVHLAAFFVAMAFLFFLGLTRVVVESGLAEAVAPLIAPGAVVGTFGSGALTGKGHAALALTFVYTSDIRTYVMASGATALKLFHDVGLRGRGLLGVLVLGTVVGLVVSIWATLAMAYRYGGATMNSWFFVSGPQQAFNWLGPLLSKPEEINHFGLGVALFGALVMVGLMAARQTFWWWPLHPVGWAIGSVWIVNQLWFTCFLAWLLKTSIVKWGGLKLYRRARPVAIGLILGQFSANLFWALIDHFAGGVGNSIFWI